MPWATRPAFLPASVIGVEDFTGDGKPDVVAGSTNASQANGRVFGMDGVDGSIKWQFNPAGSSTWALIQIDDVTGDGIKDIASGDFNGHIYFEDAVTGAQVKTLNVASDIILKFETMGDVNNDGHPDFLVAHSGPTGIVVDGFNGTFLWQKPLSDQAWNLTNMGDINWDGVNDAAIGTLYNNNKAYFLNGKNGNTFTSVPEANPCDAVSSIPDIVGDLSRELMVGGRDGSVFCLSGGYDSSTVAVNEIKNKALAVQIYPNPCRDQFKVLLTIPVRSNVRISVNDITGRTICSRFISDESAGQHTYIFNRDDLNIAFGLQSVGIITIETRQGVFHGKVLFGE